MFISLRLVDKTMRVIVNGLLVPPVHWDQNFLAIPKVISLMRREYRGANASVVAMEPAPLHSVTSFVVVDIRPIQTC